MNKYMVLGAFGLTFLILFGWISVLTVQVKSAPLVTLAISGYDPRDLLSGHYIQYQIDWEKSDCTQFSRSICPQKRFGGVQRFYVPEEYADALDWLLRHQKDERFEMVYSMVRRGRPIAVQLLVNGQDWRKAVQ